MMSNIQRKGYPVGIIYYPLPRIFVQLSDREANDVDHCQWALGTLLVIKLQDKIRLIEV